MLPRKHRLTKEQFNAVFTNGVVYKSEHLLVRARIGNTMSQYAIVVPKKVARTAVVRNTLKRKVSSCVEQCFREKKTPNGKFIFFVLHSKLPRRDVLCEEVVRVCSQ